jgi:phage terminase large subunit-like protein
VARCDERPRWIASRGVLLFPSGALGFVYGGERPGRLRGPQHHFAWCDEFAKWRHAGETWDNLMMGLRLGTAPRTLVTTTPKPVPALKRILALPRMVRTHGRTADNPDSAEDFRDAMREIYAGTRLGRQELDGEIIEERADALWTRVRIESCRIAAAPPLNRIVVAVDPPASTTKRADACGLVGAGRAEDGTFYALPMRRCRRYRLPAGRRKRSRSGAGWKPTRSWSRSTRAATWCAR